MAPATQLPTPAVPWLRDAVGCMAAGVAGLGVALLAQRPQLGWLGLSLAVALAVAVGVRGRRLQVRKQLADRLLEPVAPLLGLRVLDRRAVTLKRWGRGFPGVPGRVGV